MRKNDDHPCVQERQRLSGCLSSDGISDLGDSWMGVLRRSEPLSWFPAPGERLGGSEGHRYEIVEWMGGGAMGQVFRARDETLQREVALKFLLARKGFHQEALREARAIARLDHENIVRIFDVSEWPCPCGGPPVPFLIMECLEGETLVELLRRGALDARCSLGILEGITSGLAHAHERGLVHRDLKPGNVLLTPAGGLKLLDFGLSHFMAHAPHLPTSGTPAYMAPEQWRGEAQDARTDVWAAGVVLYELLTGRPPEVGGTTLQALKAWVLSEAPMPPVRARCPEVPREVESLLATALAKDPARRFPSARELRQEVRELRAHLAEPWAEESRPAARQCRQLVLLSCQLTGLAELAEGLDAEDLAELEEAFHQECSDIIRRHGGTVSLSMVGEVIACFGYPRVGEEDAERAVRAALLLSRSLPERLQREVAPRPLVMAGARVGLHTGRMVLDPRTLHGETPRGVSWIASQAAPGEVLIGEKTWTQLRGAFETEALGPRDFPGLAGPAPMGLHRVLRERDAGTRFDRTLDSGVLTPLVGRKRELRDLQAFWERARQGRGALVLLRGEAGLGKSRLLQELYARVPPETATRLCFQCWSRFSARAPSPLAEVLQRLLRGVLGHAPPRDVRELEAELGALGVSGEHAHLLGQLLALPVPEDAPVHQLSPERQREMTHEALVELLLAVARRRQPVLLLIEDLHWADSRCLELLEVLCARIQGSRLLAVLSARPEFQPPWPSGPESHRVDLERLPAGLAASLVRGAAHGAPLPEETVRELVRKTDGIPLFIEEMTHMVLGGGAVASIPVTLHELLLARLDLLPSRRKTLAQLCAVVGRDFSLGLLAAITERDAADLRLELVGLVEEGLLQEEGEGRYGPGYQFRHVLFQEAAYHSLPRCERKQHHRRIARVLEARFPAMVEARPEVLAHHHTEAGDLARAIPHWGRAGQLAFRRMVVPEAVSHVTRALELLRVLPETVRPPVDELEMLTALGFSLGLLKGAHAPETVRTFARCWELVRREDAVRPARWASFWNLFSYSMPRAEFARCEELAALLVREGERQHSPQLLSIGCLMRGSILGYEGWTRRALESCERALATERSVPEPDKKPIRARILVCASNLYSLSGQLERARESEREAQVWARSLGDPFVLWRVLCYASLAALFRRDVEEARRLADELIASSGERNHWLWPAWAPVIRGAALAEQGQLQEGLVLVRQEMARCRALGLQNGQTYGLVILAAIHLKLGQVREGLEVVREARELMEARGDRVSEAELLRVQGELLRAMRRVDEARGVFLRALAVAGAQGSFLFELRTRVSLGGLLRDTGHGKVARRVVAHGLARFGAGDDSADLREARELLRQLSGSERPV